MEKFLPFKNDHQVLTLGGLTIENGTDGVAIYGELVILPNQTGFEQAKVLQAFANQLVADFTKRTTLDLPAFVDKVDNPFLGD